MQRGGEKGEEKAEGRFANVRREYVRMYIRTS